MGRTAFELLKANAEIKKIFIEYTILKMVIGFKVAVCTQIYIQMVQN